MAKLKLVNPCIILGGMRRYVLRPGKKIAAFLNAAIF